MRIKAWLILLFAVLLRPLAAQPHWDNPAVYRLNKVQPHDAVVPQGDWSRSLGGRWAVSLFAAPAQAERFQHATARPPDSMQVPGFAELQGLAPWRLPEPANPPYAPTDTNTVAFLLRDFTLPPHWDGRRTIVSFGGVASAFYLYVNGREVGYSEDSRTPAEWDLTRYLRPGSNRIAVKVLRWCDGSYLEWHEAWRLTGILREVLLYSVPRTYITDLKVVATLDTADYRTGHLDVMVDLNREVQGGFVEVQCCGAVLRKALRQGDWFVSLAPAVGTVQPWADTTPVLYPLTVRLLDASGVEQARIVKQVGFRRIEVRRGLLCINGHPMAVRGMARLEQSALHGPSVSRGEMRATALRLKAMGINTVRTLHHPSDEYWYHLCDSLGLYLWDEPNIRPMLPEMADNPMWLNPMLDRLFNMYRRDRNRTCVVAWSLASLPQGSHCQEEAYRFLKGKDNTRPVVTMGTWTHRSTDIVCPPRPSPAFLARYVKRLPANIPCIPMGASPEVAPLREYLDTIAANPRLQGLFYAGDEVPPLK